MSSATVTHRPAGHFTVDAGGQRRRIPWRQIHEIGSAAFWIDQTTRSPLPTRHALGNGLREEFTACILGGFGIRGAMTLAAFHAAPVTPACSLTVLNRPQWIWRKYCGRP